MNPERTRDEYARDMHCDSEMNEYRDEVRLRLQNLWKVKIDEKFFYNVIVKGFQEDDHFMDYLMDDLELNQGHKYAMNGQDDKFWHWRTTPGKGFDYDYDE